MLQGMSELCMSIGGTEVRFPGGRNPYGVQVGVPLHAVVEVRNADGRAFFPSLVQKSIMLRVIQAADAGSNALISAPTGCGKVGCSTPGRSLADLRPAAPIYDALLFRRLYHF